MLYRKTFRVPEGKHFFIEFETVRQSLYVYVNGRFAGFYEAGITASGYDLTPFVKSGEDALVAVVTENTGSRGTKCVSAEMKEKPGDWGGAGYQWAGTDFNPVQGGIVGNVKLHVKENDAYITLPLWNTLKTKGAYVWADNFDFAKGEADVHVEAEVVLAAKNAKNTKLRVTVAGQSFKGAVEGATGLVDAVRIPKENFYVHQVMYAQTPKVKILGHWNYPKKTAENYWYSEKVDDGKVIAYTGKRKQRDPEHKTVYVIGSLSVDSVRLFVNGRQVGEAKLVRFSATSPASS